MHSLSRTAARRIAIQAQLLAQQRPTDLVDLVRHLTLLQLDPTAAIAPNADLVAWSRLGGSYRPGDLVDALRDRRLLELDALLRPAEDLVLFRGEMAQWPGPEPLPDWQRSRLEWVAANDACRRDILRRLEQQGPLPSRELPDTCAVPWQSSGWTNDRNVTKLLDLLVASGQVAVAGRVGRERLWDLAARVYPEAAPLPPEDALRARAERRLSALGIARAKMPEAPMEPYDVGEVGEPAVVEGVKGAWRVDPAYLDQPFTGRTALLSPFDRLVHDRRRTSELFEFEYFLEMYKPAAQRRWGYFALPVLHDDRLVGKLDAKADRSAGVLQVNALHADVELDADAQAAIRRDVDDLAGWLGLEVAGGT